MPYQFCCMVQALVKSQNQSPPNFKSLWIDSSEHFAHLLVQYYVWCESVENDGYAADWCDH